MESHRFWSEIRHLKLEKALDHGVRNELIELMKGTFPVLHQSFSLRDYRRKLFKGINEGIFLSHLERWHDDKIGHKTVLFLNSTFHQGPLKLN